MTAPYQCARCRAKTPLCLIDGAVTCYDCGEPMELPLVEEGAALSGLVSGIIYALLLLGMAAAGIYGLTK